MKKGRGWNSRVLMTIAGAVLLATFLSACEPRSFPVDVPTMTKPPPTLAIFAPAAPEPMPISCEPPPPSPDNARMQCVAYARAVTGLDLKSDAWRWWKAASGHYQRGPEPAAYSVLVLSQGNRLSRG